MFIKSKFIDFYDFVPQMLGFQPDKQIVYVRNKLSDIDGFYKENINKQQSDKIHFSKINNKFIKEEMNLINSAKQEFERFLIKNKKQTLDIIIKAIFICDKVCIILKQNQKQSKFYFYIFERYYDKYSFRHCKFEFKTIDELNEEDKIKMWYSVDKNFIKLIGSPIFVLDNDYLFNNIPCLMEYGINKLLNPQELYQKIETYLTSVIKDNPDTKPPVEISNKYKIEAAGFDLKISFRHPIN